MGSVFDDGGYIGEKKSYIAKYIPLTTFSFLASSVAESESTITVPSSARAGDIAVIHDNINSSVNVAAPSGWTLIKSDSAGDTNQTIASYYKLLTSDDPGASVASAIATTTDHFMVCAVFRAGNNTEASAITLSGVQGQCTTGDPSAQTIAIAGASTPTIAFMAFSQRGSNGPGLGIVTVPGNDGSVDALKSGVLKTRLYYRIYNSGSVPANISGDINDQGAQGIQSWYFTFTSKTGTNPFAVSSGIWNLNGSYTGLR